MSEIEDKKIIKNVENISRTEYITIVEAVLLLCRYIEKLEERVEELEKKGVM